MMRAAIIVALGAATLALAGLFVSPEGLVLSVVIWLFARALGLA